MFLWDLCVKLKPLLFSRVEVLEMSQKADSWGPDSVLVKFIDEGRTGLVTRHQLLPLPENFHALPPQAVEFIVCRVKPADNEVEWNPKVSYFGSLCPVDFENIHRMEVYLSVGRMRPGPGQLTRQLLGSLLVRECADSSRPRASSQAPENCLAPSSSLALTVLELV